MASTLKLKRSAVQNKVPLTTDLQLGELAVNTYDGKLYLKKDNGTQSIVEIGAGGSSGPSGPAWMNVATITADFTVPSGYNAMSVGPITIANGVTVTVSDNAVWRIFE